MTRAAKDCCVQDPASGLFDTIRTWFRKRFAPRLPKYITFIQDRDNNALTDVYKLNDGYYEPLVGLWRYGSRTIHRDSDGLWNVSRAGALRVTSLTEAASPTECNWPQGVTCKPLPGNEKAALALRKELVPPSRDKQRRDDYISAEKSKWLPAG